MTPKPYHSRPIPKVFTNSDECSDFNSYQEANPLNGMVEQELVCEWFLWRALKRFRPLYDKKFIHLLDNSYHFAFVDHVPILDRYRGGFGRCIWRFLGEFSAVCLVPWWALSFYPLKYCSEPTIVASAKSAGCRFSVFTSMRAPSRSVCTSILPIAPYFGNFEISK